MRCFMTNGQRHRNTARERQEDREEEEGGGGGSRGRESVIQIELTSFCYTDLKQIFTVCAFQATCSEISPSTRAPEDPIQTGRPSLTVTVLARISESSTVQKWVKNKDEKHI